MGVGEGIKNLLNKIPGDRIEFKNMPEKLRVLIKEMSQNAVGNGGEIVLKEFTSELEISDSTEMRDALTEVLKRHKGPWRIYETQNSKDPLESSFDEYVSNKSTRRVLQSIYEYDQKQNKLIVTFPDE